MDCRQGETATCLYVIISGRLRLVREEPTAEPPVRVEEEVGRGEAVGAVWALAGGYHDTTALCVRDAELVRMSRVSSASFRLWALQRAFQGFPVSHDDTKPRLQGAFELIAAQCPLAVAGMLSGIGRRLAAASAMRSRRSMYDPSGRAAVATPVPAGGLRNGATGGGASRRGEVVTVALVSAGEPVVRCLDRTTKAGRAGTLPKVIARFMTSLRILTGCQSGDGLNRPSESAAMTVRKLGGLLKHTLEELFGPTLLLSSSSMELIFPTSFGRLSTTFFRTKITSWIAAQEEDYRSVVLQNERQTQEKTLRKLPLVSIRKLSSGTVIIMLYTFCRARECRMDRSSGEFLRCCLADIQFGEAFLCRFSLTA